MHWIPVAPVPMIPTALSWTENWRGPTKTRIVRALNAVLAQKKKPEIGLRDLF